TARGEPMTSGLKGGAHHTGDCMIQDCRDGRREWRNMRRLWDGVIDVRLVALAKVPDAARLLVECGLDALRACQSLYLRNVLVLNPAAFEPRLHRVVGDVEL